MPEPLHSASETTSYDQLRLLLTLSILAGLAPLLLHPDVPLLMKALTGMASPGIRNFGYVSHLGAYFGASLMILMIYTPTTVLRMAGILTVLSLHAATTELLQMWIPSRDCDPWDLLCNLGGVLTATVVWHLLNVVGLNSWQSLTGLRRISLR